MLPGPVADKAMEMLKIRERRGRGAFFKRLLPPPEPLLPRKNFDWWEGRAAGVPLSRKAVERELWGPIFLRAPPLNGFGFYPIETKAIFKKNHSNASALIFFYDTLSNAFFLMETKAHSACQQQQTRMGLFFSFLQRRPLINWERREQGFDKKKSLRRMRGSGREKEALLQKGSFSPSPVFIYRPASILPSAASTRWRGG